MKLKITLLVLLSYLVISCYQQKKENIEGPEVIDITYAFERRVPININDISGDCDYIVLQTTDECLIGSNYSIYSDDQYLVAIDRKQILLFDRESGRFIRKIGNSGNGPDEYSRTYSKIPYDEEKRVVYADRNRERFEYSIDGQLINTRKGPEMVFDFINIDESTYAAFIDNYMGDEKNKMVLFNETDSIVKIFPNYQSFPFNGSINVFYSNSWFYKLNKQLYFCERFSDTLFAVTQDSLIPRFVFDKGVHTFPYELRADVVDQKNEYFFTENILESSRYLFYTFRFKQEVYTAVHDKKQKSTLVNDYVGESGKGFINNINDFAALELSSINGKGELTCTIDAFKIKLWFEKNPEKSDELPECLQKLRNITDTENPIVVITRLNE
ncbi:MAG: 6-bladed beta-propeller [Bacteroidales bacterium]